jgi:predicted AlkP superfamily phosphohydrolase/phosphomutase
MTPHSFRALAAALLGLAAWACSDRARVPRTAPPHRLLVVGWDGATWRTLDPMLARGELPNLAKLIARGSSARLESTAVPISSAAWVGAVTGRTPGETGVYGFFEPVPGTSEVRLISALSNRATPLWRILARHGQRSVVFGVPVTYPPEPIPGVMVGCMLSPHDAIYTAPAGLTERYRKRGFVPDLGIWRTEQQLTAKTLEQDNRVKREILLELMAEVDWDLFFVVFKNLDVLCHYAYGDPQSPPVVALCRELDRSLGDLVAAAGPEANVVVLSDHGFQAYEQTFFPHPWLIERGFSVRSGQVGQNDLLGPLDQRRAREHARLMEQLDLEQTRAFVGLCEGNYGGIRLNLRGREPRGQVAPEQAEALLVELERALAEVVTPEGRPLVVRTWRGAELYPGPHQDLVSDLVFETIPEVNVGQSLQEQAFRRWPTIKSADHDRSGILVLAGPSVAGIAERTEARIFDLAPTALALLGLPVYEEMDGAPLLRLLEGVAAPRVVPDRSEARAGELDWMRRLPRSDSSPEVEARLRELGYTR